MVVVEADPKHGVVDQFVAIRMYGHGFRHDCLNFLRHYAELPALAPGFAIFGLVVEQVEADAEGVDPNADDVFLDVAVGSPPPV